MRFEGPDLVEIVGARRDALTQGMRHPNVPPVPPRRGDRVFTTQYAAGSTAAIRQRRRHRRPNHIRFACVGSVRGSLRVPAIWRQGVTAVQHPRVR